jgi:hypothetical protein
VERYKAKQKKTWEQYREAISEEVDTDCFENWPSQQDASMPSARSDVQEVNKKIKLKEMTLD